MTNASSYVTILAFKQQHLLMKLKNSIIKGHLYREKSAEGAFNDILSSIDFLAKIAVAIFFSPVITITSIFSHNTILSIVNILITLSSIFNEGYRAFTGKNSISYFIGTSIGVTLSSLLVLYISLDFLSSEVTLFSFIILANTICSAANVFLAIKEILFPPLFETINYTLDKLGWKINFDFYLGHFKKFVDILIFFRYHFPYFL